MNVLVYSTKCEHCAELISFINENESILSVTRFHDINSNGVPRGVTRVPTMIVKNKMLVGRDIRDYLESIIPQDTEAFNFGPKIGSSMDGTCFDDGMCSIQNFGQKLEPTISKELKEKINKSVQDAYQQHKEYTN